MRLSASSIDHSSCLAHNGVLLGRHLLISVHRKSSLRVDGRLNLLGLTCQGHKLLIRHFGELEHLCISVGGDELFNDHETSTDSNDQLTVQDLGINLLCTEKIESISNLSDRHRAVSLIDVVGKHLIENITLWHLEDWLCLLVLDLSVHELNDLILILDKKFKFLNFINFGGNSLTKLIESIDQKLLILSKSLDIGVVSLDMVLQVSDLTSQELNLFVEVNLLLSQVVELKNLVVDDELSLLKSEVDPVYLVLDLLDLLFGVVDHLVAVLDLVFELPGKLLLFGFLVVLLEKLLSLVEEVGLLFSNDLHLIEVFLDLFEVGLGLGAGGVHICNEKLELAGPLTVLGLESVLHVDSLLLHVVELSGEIFDLSLVSLSLIVSI